MVNLKHLFYFILFYFFPFVGDKKESNPTPLIDRMMEGVIKKRDVGG